MKRLLSILFSIFINMGLLFSQQEAPIDNLAEAPAPSDTAAVTVVAEPPVLTKALKDTLQTHLKLARRFTTNARSADFKQARQHIARLLSLNDSLQLHNADYLAAAGDVESLFFDNERNKPVSGGKTDEAACLLAAKAAYLYYIQAYDLYCADSLRYGKNGLKQRQRIQQASMQYFLLTRGFQVNAGKSFKQGDLKTTLDEFRMSFDGSVQPFLLEVYQQDPKRNAAFETFMADSTQCRALYNCATVSSALGLFDDALGYYDSLKIRGYEPEKVYRNTLAIYSSRRDTIMLITELMRAIETMPRDTWFQKNLLQIYVGRHQWQEAAELADRTLAIDTADAQTYGLRGQLYEMQGDLDSAMLYYLTSYDLDSTQANVCSYIGRIHYNKAVALKAKLYDQRQFKKIFTELQPIYNEALPWYERAYAYDTLHLDNSIATAIREILYSRFTQARCPNRAQLIAEYNEVSRAYNMSQFGK